MATTNPFDLLGDDDNDDLSQLIAKKAALAPTTTAPTQQQQPKQPAKLPSKPAPPAQAVREAKSEGRGGGRGGGRGDYGRGRGGGGYNRDRSNNENSFNNNGMSAPFASPEDGGVEKSSERRGGYGGGPRGSFRGGRRGGNNNGEFDGEQRRNRVFERRSGTGRGNEIKREGSGRGNWGSAADEIAPDSEEVPTATENVNTEKQPAEEVTADTAKENPIAEPEEKEPEEKEMTLDEYQKILEEKKKALPGANTETRKVEVDKELKSMQPLASKKSNFDVFIKLGSDKDKRKEIADKDEKAKKAVSITEFLKPAEGERGYYPGGRGRGRGRGPRGGGFNGGSNPVLVEAPKIEDPGQFPNLK